jgi:hypothetical protein
MPKDVYKKKDRFKKWNMICRPKDQGGLGVEVLEIKNKCILSIWLIWLGMKALILYSMCL